LGPGIGHCLDRVLCQSSPSEDAQRAVRQAGCRFRCRSCSRPSVRAAAWIRALFWQEQ